MASTFISLPSVAAAGPIDVIITAANDSIRISDGTDTLAVNPDGSINVVSTDSGDNQSTFGEAPSVAISATATVVSQLFATAAKLRQVHMSGTNRGTFTLLFDATEVDKRRLSLQNFNADMDFETGIEIPAGTTVSVEVENAGPSTGSFNALLLYSAT